MLTILVAAGHNPLSVFITENFLVIKYPQSTPRQSSMKTQAWMETVSCSTARRFVWIPLPPQMLSTIELLKIVTDEDYSGRISRSFQIIPKLWGAVQQNSKVTFNTRKYQKWRTCNWYVSRGRTSKTITGPENPAKFPGARCTISNRHTAPRSTRMEKTPSTKPIRTVHTPLSADTTSIIV